MIIKQSNNVIICSFVLAVFMGYSFSWQTPICTHCCYCWYIANRSCYLAVTDQTLSQVLEDSTSSSSSFYKDLDDDDPAEKLHAYLTGENIQQPLYENNFNSKQSNTW